MTSAPAPVLPDLRGIPLDQLAAALPPHVAAAVAEYRKRAKQSRAPLSSFNSSLGTVDLG